LYGPRVLGSHVTAGAKTFFPFLVERVATRTHVLHPQSFLRPQRLPVGILSHSRLRYYALYALNRRYLSYYLNILQGSSCNAAMFCISVRYSLPRAKAVL
jgi:hypothetical protein